MQLVKQYENGRIKIYNRDGHFEIRVDGKFKVSCDNWKEVDEELEMIYDELNREA